MRPLPVLLALALVVAACSSDDGSSEAPAGALPPEATYGSGEELHPVRLAQLGETVTSVTADPSGGAVLVGRRSGAVFRMGIEDVGGHLVPSLDPEPVLDLGDTVTTDGERGLLDLLAAPDGRLYASYTEPSGAVVLARWRPDLASPPEVLARLPHPFAGHNGGDLEWLDDGDTLLWALGDMDLTTTTPPAAQDLADAYGSIVALDVASGDPLAPLDAAALARHQVVVGVRNPWRIHVAGESLLVGDVGEDRIEELDAVPLADLDPSDPVNLGWPYFEGRRRTDVPMPAPIDHVEPILERPHDETVCAIVAGVVLPSTSSLLVGDNCSGQVLAVDLDEPTAEPQVVAEVDEGVVAFGLGTRDDVYAVGLFGGVWRLDPRAWRVDDLPAVDVPAPAAAAVVALPADQQQAVCDAQQALQSLEDARLAGPAELERLLTDAIASFDAAAPDLPSSVDQQLLRSVLEEIASTAEAASWRVDAPAFIELLAALTRAEPPYDGFPDAIAVLVDLGRSC